jgi:hypothetical protein
MGRKIYLGKDPQWTLVHPFLLKKSNPFPLFALALKPKQIKKTARHMFKTPARLKPLEAYLTTDYSQGQRIKIYR